MFAVDTNILLYAAIRQFPEHGKAATLMELWRKEQQIWFATWNVIYEFLRVSTHAAVLQRPLSLASALRFIEELQQTSNFSILNERENHFEVLRQLAIQYPRVAANVVHDFHTAALLYEHGVRVLYTADTDFLQFRFLEVIDPVHE